MKHIVQVTSNVALVGEGYQNRQFNLEDTWLVPWVGLGPKRRGPNQGALGTRPTMSWSSPLFALFFLLFLEVQSSAPSSLPALHTLIFSGNPSTLASLIRIIASSLLFWSEHAAMQTEMKARLWAWMKSKIRRLQNGVRAFWIRGLECTPRKSLRSRGLQLFFPEFNFDELG